MPLPDNLTAASWELAAHTSAKLQILGAYLRAWFPILSQARPSGRIIYIDGFAGPGRYKQGEDGSPIVALKAALGVLAKYTQTTYEFHFVERKKPVAAALQANVDHFKQQRVVPTNVEIFVHGEMTFEEAYFGHIRRHLQSYPHAPAFALVDPCGWTGIPMTILAEMMRRPSTEIFINFMFEEINRFINLPEQANNFDALFACKDWRGVKDLTGPRRRKFIPDLYLHQLHRAAGAKYVRSFEMRNERNVIDYFLYFASNNLLGLAKMKEAMWKVDPGGGFTFSDATNPDQTVLFQAEPDSRMLRRFIAEEFAGRRVTVEQVETFVIASTAFLKGHYNKVLKAMEADGDATPVDPPAARRRGTYPDRRLVLQFK